MRVVFDVSIGIEAKSYAQVGRVVDQVADLLEGIEEERRMRYAITNFQTRPCQAVEFGRAEEVAQERLAMEFGPPPAEEAVAQQLETEFNVVVVGRDRCDDWTTMDEAREQAEAFLGLGCSAVTIEQRKRYRGDADLAPGRKDW